MQCLPAEAQAPDARLQVLDPVDLGGGVLADRGTGRRLVHPVPVVGDRDGFGAPGLDVDVDSGRPGVEAVLDQFLHDGRRALDHLAGRDLGDGLRIEFADLGHEAESAGG